MTEAGRVVVQPIPDFSGRKDSYTFPSTGEWPGHLEREEFHVTEEEAAVHV
jgi:hypothetical protein